MIPCLLLGGFIHGSETWVGAINVALSLTHVSVSVANNFVHSSTAADQGYHAFGELAVIHILPVAENQESLRIASC